MNNAVNQYRHIILNYVSHTLTSINFSQFDERSILIIIEKLNEIERTLNIDIFNKITFKKNLNGIECSFSLKTLCNPLNLIRWKSFFETPAGFNKEITESICKILLDIEKEN